jgi:hypothetical protein
MVKSVAKLATVTVNVGLFPDLASAQAWNVSANIDADEVKYYDNETGEEITE